MGTALENIQIKEASGWLDELRRIGRKAFAAKGLPTAKTESWKYTRPRNLQVDDFVSSLRYGKVSSSAPELPFSADEIVIANGSLISHPDSLPSGVTLSPLDEAQEYLSRLSDLENYPFAALNTAYLQEGLMINIAPGTILNRPLALRYHTEPGENNLYANFRTIILCGSGSKAEVVETFTYAGEVKSRYFNNLVTQVFLQAGAVLNHYKFQDEAFKAAHIALTAADIAEEASYNSFCLQKGADLARNETKIALRGSQARAEVNAAYMISGWATVDTTTDISHLVPETYSCQLVKGVVGGDAKGVFQGKIHIAPNAVKTEGKQLHKALLLSDRAEIDVKPELEIFADDVKCSHGAASGELDEEQLFYMQSRGIGRDEAKQILIDAYLDDVIATVKNESLRNWYKSLI